MAEFSAAGASAEDDDELLAELETMVQGAPAAAEERAAADARAARDAEIKDLETRIARAEARRAEAARLADALPAAPTAEPLASVEL